MININQISSLVYIKRFSRLENATADHAYLYNIIATYS